jgi:alkylation response protein AidB-like acyl-CoA dehydrogenase
MLEQAVLRALTRLAGSVTTRLRLRGLLGKTIYHGARLGTEAIRRQSSVAKRAKREPGDPQRLGPAASQDVFDMRPTEDQELVRAAVRRFAEEVLRPAARAADDGAAAPPQLLTQAHALGLAGLAVPEALGGAATARSAVTGALVAEELSRGDMGLATAILAPLAVVHAIVTWGTADQQAHHLPMFLSDRFVPAALALLEPQPLFDPMRPRAGAVRSHDGGWALWGEKSLVPLAATAERFVVAASVLGLGVRLFIVERDAPGLVVEAEPAMGLRAAGLGRLRLEGVRVADDALLGGEAPGESFDVADLVDRARIAWGAMAVGAAQAVLDYVVPYTNARWAFGEPISNRQAVAFLVADIAIELEGMRLLVHRAAGRVDRGEGAGRHAALARLQCSSKGTKIGSDGVQLLGGHGFVKEHPVERWYRDLRAVGVLEGALLV